MPFLAVYGIAQLAIIHTSFLNMLSRFLFAFLIIIQTTYCGGQNNRLAFNFDFEENTANRLLPNDWLALGELDYEFQADSLESYQGLYSGTIYQKANKGNNSFGALLYRLPGSFKADTIRLEGFMKIDKVKDGFAGLFLRVDGAGKTLVLENMEHQNVRGSHDWKKYSITVSFPDNATRILVGGLLTGSGRVWLDSFEVYLDGILIQEYNTDDKEKVGSGININMLTDYQIQQLYKVAKIWGFVKYFHPQVAKGKFNWDDELFYIIGEVLKLTETEKVNLAINNWLNNIREIGSQEEVEKARVISDSEILWIKDKEKLGAKLVAQLISIYGAPRLNEHYYVGFVSNVGNPEFKNELTYPDMDYGDDGLKLLSLIRYWNMIEYFYPYKHLMDHNWDSVLYEFIPKIIETNNELSYKLTLLELIGRVQDTHAGIWGGALDEFWGRKVAPIRTRFIEDQLVVTKLFQGAAKSGTEIGDVITKIKGEEISSLVEQNLKYAPASNYITQLRILSTQLTKTNGDSLSVEIANKGKIRLKARDRLPTDFWRVDKPSHKMLENNIGYIFPGSLTQGKGEIDTIMNSFINTKGLIIDFRARPRDFLVFSLGKYLMPQPTEFVKFSLTSLQNPGQFNLTESIKTGEQNNNYYQGQVVILVNESTQSSAEYQTMALKVAPRATVIGSTTAGADGNVSLIILPGSVRTFISGIGVYYPDGTETQRVGIVPDIEVRPTIEGIRSGRDELLEKAIQIIYEN